MPLRREVPKEGAATIKVYAKDENIAKYIKHPKGTRFDKSGMAFWPNDSFTQRRIKDGDVTTEASKKEAPRHATHRESKPA